MPLDSLEIQFYFILNHTLQFPNIQMVGWANLKISVMFYVISLINVLFLVLFLKKGNREIQFKKGNDNVCTECLFF